MTIATVKRDSSPVSSRALGTWQALVGFRSNRRNRDKAGFHSRRTELSKHHRQKERWETARGGFGDASRVPSRCGDDPN
ncbi:predicted protein [Chaetomium globosum CBS 148.51]|uniref:Uncharacterized protein n=1 Tax=Chaetomium globosum (strain ATCC 6205 / CBS 148.51 / DSM 1962 / NBRC 6347 / NRRL 1970) TaxID=306901 RepID=Q2H6D7_CHAGB|nr:uncharacterized protein CHGG_05778 [Chaetomium globosum CBS 148.51]EAQ89159.1 predicted protein [Chaetomium globosum CBS 148.51]